MNKTGIWSREIRDENLFYFRLRAISKGNPTQENSSFNNQEVVAGIMKYNN